MTIKTCPKCQSRNTISKGSRRGTKRYFCHGCDSCFSSKRRPNNLQ